jgi:predicted N-formylglutamate amidohydrolase
VLIVCDHAVSDLKFMKATDPEQGLLRSFEAFDAGAGDLASSLSERLECLGVLTNFGKLVIDPSLPITSQDLIRTEYLSEELPVSFNHTGFRLWERLSDFYLEYQKILSEIMVSVDPKIIISVHSHEQGDHM